MQLLVSVRSAAEAIGAVTGGADVIDAKEPARGSLGPVDATTLGEIAAVVPASVPLSAALGDFDRPETAEAVVRKTVVPRRPTPVYLKLGFQGVNDAAALEAIVGAAVSVARARDDEPRVVAVAYADHEAARCAPPAMIAGVARHGGAYGVLVDTWTKDGRDLLHWMPPPELVRWVTSASEEGLMVAVAGSLGLEAALAVADCGADVLGVRGAVCDGGRDGEVNPARVRAMRRIVGGATRGRSVVLSI
jgi:(5-formylfuran-3-yl)methyl phosphate synthase